jgi:hypothetical protein
MITTRITVKPHIAEYIRGKFAGSDPTKPVHFPSHLDIYLMIWDYLVKRPAGCGRDAGNLEIVLPSRHGAKSPEYYNYLSQQAQKMIGRRLELMMWAEYRESVESGRHAGMLYIDITSHFMERYAIRSLSEDAFLKSYYRFRNRYYRSGNGRTDEKKISAQTA